MPTHGPLIHGHPITPQIAAPAFPEPTTPPHLIHPASGPCPWQGRLLLLNSFYMPISIASTNQLQSQAHCPTFLCAKTPCHTLQVHPAGPLSSMLVLPSSPSTTLTQPSKSPLTTHPSIQHLPLSSHPSFSWYHNSFQYTQHASLSPSTITHCLATHTKHASHSCTLSTHVFTNTVTPTVTLIVAQPHNLLRAMLQHLQKLSLMGQHVTKYGFIHLHVHTHFVCIDSNHIIQNKQLNYGYCAV